MKKILIVTAILFSSTSILPTIGLAGEDPVGALCGTGTDKPACECGDTVMGNFTLTSNMNHENISGSAFSCLTVGADGITIDGNGYSISGIPSGLEESAINSDNHTGLIVRNFTFFNLDFGVQISNIGTGVVVEDNVFHDVNYGVLLSSVTDGGAVIQDNTFRDVSVAGVYIDGGTQSNTIQRNTLTRVGKGAFFGFQFGTGNTYADNIVTDSILDFGGDSLSTTTNNTFTDTASSSMLTFADLDEVKNKEDTVSFSFSMQTPNGVACNTCTPTFILSPSEPSFEWAKIGNTVSGSFTATRAGFYSLKVVVTDTNGNTTTRNRSFVIDAGESTVRYYMRSIAPTHGQPSYGTGIDVRSLLFTPPSVTEEWFCGQWVQNSVDELMDYPLAFLKNMSIYSSYSAASLGVIGVQRYGNYSPSVSTSSAVAASVYPTYVEVTKTFNDLNWMMDYPKSWYWLTSKIADEAVYWRTTVADPTYVDITYQHSIAPAIKSMTNEMAVIISSATQSDTSTQDAVIVLENRADSATSTTLTLTGFDRPFLEIASTIDVTGTTTVTVDLGASATTSISAVSLDIAPNAGSIEVAITTWETDGDYQKEWTEEGSGVASALHTVGDLVSGTSYEVKVGGTTIATETADENGTINFNYTYTDDYSTKTFTITETPAVVAQIYSGSTLARRQQALFNPTLPIASAPTITQLQAQLTILQAQLAALLQNQNSPSTPPGTTGLTPFTTPLSLGQSHPDIKRLQIFLNTHGFPVAVIGPGSSNQETTYFGPLTQQALAKFQLQNQLISSLADLAAGYLGPKTRALINSQLPL